MNRAFYIITVIVAAAFLIPAGPSRAEEAKAMTKAIILQGLRVVQGFQGQQARPDLIVEKVWLDDACQIHVRVKNVGNGAITDAEYSKAVLRIASGKQFKDYPYVEGAASGQPAFDPGGALKAPGGVVEFNTGIKIDRALNVSVFADPRRSIKESNEGNNRKTEYLNPQCSQQGLTIEKAAQSASTQSEKAEPVPSAQQDAEEVVIQDHEKSGKPFSEQSGVDSNR